MAAGKILKKEAKRKLLLHLIEKEGEAGRVEVVVTRLGELDPCN